MAKETIFTLIIIAVVLSSTIGLVFFFSFRKAKYEQFVLSHSESIKKIDQLNTNYTFKAFRTNISFYHRFDNKGYWYKTEPIAFLSREIRNDLETNIYCYRYKGAIIQKELPSFNGPNYL